MSDKKSTPETSYPAPRNRQGIPIHESSQRLTPEPATDKQGHIDLKALLAERGTLAAENRKLKEELETVVTAALAYDAAIISCANNPEKMATFCTAEGDNLDKLYLDFIQAAHAANDK